LTARFAHRLFTVAVAFALTAGLALSGAGTSGAAQRESVKVLDTNGSGSKSTQLVRVSSEWELHWTYDCSNLGSASNFQVYIHAKGGGLVMLNDVNQLAASGQGVEHYHTAGTFYFEVNSGCNWTMKVVDRPSAGHGALPQPRTGGEHTLLDLQGSGSRSTETFKTGDEWDLQWTYDCAKLGSSIFQVYIKGKGNGLVTLIDVNQMGKSGQGVEHYHKGGTYFFEVNSGCDWTIKVVDRS
jgi:hypothetical protein